MTHSLAFPGRGHAEPVVIIITDNGLRGHRKDKKYTLPTFFPPCLLFTRLLFFPSFLSLFTGRTFLRTRTLTV